MALFRAKTYSRDYPGAPPTAVVARGSSLFRCAMMDRFLTEGVWRTLLSGF
jgi:hypothetical protein